MIQHHNGLTPLQKLGALRNAGLIDIHHHKHCVVAHRLQRKLTVDNHVVRIVIVVPEHLNHRLHG